MDQNLSYGLQSALYCLMYVYIIRTGRRQNADTHTNLRV
jgi:hypothetical protein